MVTFSVGNVRAGGKASTSRRGKRWKEEGTIEGRWPVYLEKKNMKKKEESAKLELESNLYPF